MDKRAFIAGILALPLAIGSAAVQAKDTVVKTLRWSAPAGVTKIRVRSWDGNNRVIDTYISVKPGQRFVFEAIKP
jgi:hypothetical protein|tara:strand:+ start:2321 stop:2545 length:225 start_codon:yes stop_codon:yes gene_type:complete